MKKDIHPKWYPNAKVICNGEVVMTVGSTKPELHVDVWSGNHPFYTGQQRIIDTAGRVDRFMERLKQYSSHQEKAEKREKQAKAKAQMRFLKQQLAALDLEDSIHQALHDANIVTVGDLEKKLENARDELLEVPKFTPQILDNLASNVKEARKTYFAKDK